MTEIIQIIVDLRQNVLRLCLPDAAAERGQLRPVPAILDIGEAGALLGLELSLADTPELQLPATVRHNASDSTYLTLADSMTPLARSATVNAEVVADASGTITEIVVPRRGPTYEISFPSGNQCWIPKRNATGSRQALGWCSVMRG